MTVNEDELPAGWTLQKGAGGWYAVNRAKKWATTVHCDTAKEGPGKPRAIAAAIKLEEQAQATLEERERLCAALRAYFGRDTNAT